MKYVLNRIKRQNQKRKRNLILRKLIHFIFYLPLNQIKQKELLEREKYFEIFFKSKQKGSDMYINFISVILKEERRFSSKITTW